MMFVFKFAALLRIRRHRRDQCRQLLAEVLSDIRALEVQRAELEQRRTGQLDELRSLGRPGPVDVDRAAARRYFAGQLVGELAGLARRQELVEQQLELCRQTLVKADQDVKVLEKLEEKQRAAFQFESERRGARELEEAWQAARLTEVRR